MNAVTSTFEFPIGGWKFTELESTFLDFLDLIHVSCFIKILYVFIKQLCQKPPTSLMFSVRLRAPNWLGDLDRARPGEAGRSCRPQLPKSFPSFWSNSVPTNVIQAPGKSPWKILEKTHFITFLSF